MKMLYWNTALLIFIYFNIVFLIGYFKKDNGIVDVFWGLGFSLVAWFWHIEAPHSHSLLLAILISLWGLRLAIYIGIRNARKKTEDWRYADWRKAWGKWVHLRAYFQVFILQGFFMFIIALPIMQRPATEELQWFQYLGILIWLIGLLWESIADYQLFQFKKKPENKGRILTKGLWYFSRHPNYFGEALLWWGIFLVVLPWGLWYLSLIGVLTITLLLRNVSGVPFLEYKYRDNPEYLEYIRSTPALIPALWKRSNS